MKIAVTSRLRLRWTRGTRADSTISSSSVRLWTVLVVSETAIDPAVSGVIKRTGFAVVDDLAVPHGDHAMRVSLGELEVMGGAEHSDAGAPVHVAQVVENHQRRFGVEACDRFVGEENLGFLGQRSGERD